LKKHDKTITTAEEPQGATGNAGTMQVPQLVVNEMLSYMDACVNAAQGSIPQTNCKPRSGPNSRTADWNALLPWRE